MGKGEEKSLREREERERKERGKERGSGVEGVDIAWPDL